MTHVEDLQRAALRELDEALASQRAANAGVIAAAAKCNDVGVSIERIRAMAGVSRDKVYRWLRSTAGGDQSAGESQAPKAAPSRRRGQSKRDT